MDSDPWADTPSTPKIPLSSSTPTSPSSSPSKPLKVETTSPVLGESSNSTLAPKPSSPTEATVGSIPPPTNEEFVGEDDGFDDFDDFDEPAIPIAGPSGSQTINDGGNDDDNGFGDFGDFEEGDFDDQPIENDINQSVITEEPASEQKERWHALNLRPFPPKGELLDQLSTLLMPLHESSNLNSNDYLTKEQPRIGNGLSQILVSESSRDTYAQLTTAPILKPLDWTRSRVRRDHLISMGVPVNLDEVDSHRLSALPPLRITTNLSNERQIPRRAESLDVNNSRYSSSQKGKSREISPNNHQGISNTAPNSSGGYTNGGTKGIGKYGLGNKPEFDMVKAEEYCGLEEDQLSLLPLAALQKLQSELARTSALASSRLAWELQFKDAQTQDSTTYNGMISELISNAAKVKSAQVTSGGVFRKSSIKRPQSVHSGIQTPRRTGSPGMW
ncbi:uncharacterized protein L201_005117 [Kwoniella dendrophila CBS 6074]|uniref:Uncharacterized protein n=1 Tax=Kwoniella dendrophila CBS 6074 TaxID=1295534 RepID=A0AAX4JZ89_9TREE